MKKLGMIILIMLVAVTMFATGTRVAGFGGISYGDASETGNYLGLRTNFHNLFWATMKTPGADNDYVAGIYMDVASGVLVIDFNSKTNPIFAPGIIPNINQEKTMAFSFSKEISNFNVGAKVLYGADNFENDDLTEKAQTIGLGIGASNHNFDFGMKYTMPTYSHEFKDSDNSATIHGMKFDTSFRYLPCIIGSVNIIPEAKYNFSSESFDNEDSDGENSDLYKTVVNNFSLNTLIGYDMSKATKVLFQVEIFGMNSELTEYDEDFSPNTISINETHINPLGTWRIGLESAIKPWLTGRCGAIKNFDKFTTKVDNRNDIADTETTTKTENFNLTFGLSFKFGKFILDANFNEELLFTGPNFISGSNQDWASALSLIYKF